MKIKLLKSTLDEIQDAQKQLQDLVKTHHNSSERRRFLESSLAQARNTMMQAQNHTLDLADDKVVLGLVIAREREKLSKQSLDQITRSTPDDPQQAWREHYKTALDGVRSAFSSVIERNRAVIAEELTGSFGQDDAAKMAHHSGSIAWANKCLKDGFFGVKTEQTKPDDMESACKHILILCDFLLGEEHDLKELRKRFL